MTRRFSIGQAVHTAFGKGVVRQVRNGGWLRVDVGGRTLVVAAADVSPSESPGATSHRGGSRRRSGESSGHKVPGHEARASRRATEIDLHGLAPEDALVRVERAVNAALLADIDELRLIHGRGSGRLRAALHRMLRGMPVRSVRLDPRNEGVTIVAL